MNLTVLTTRPILGDNLSLPIYSDHLIIRPFRSTDIQSYHTLLSEPEAMEGNNMSPNVSYTEEILEDQFPPYHSQVILGIFLKKSDGSEGDFIGEGGAHHLRTTGEWPELSYRFKKQYWNRGYATEFAKSFMRFWWNLPRETVNLQVRPTTVSNEDTSSIIRERVYASVKQGNKASQRVLYKTGFELFNGTDQDWYTEWLNIKDY